MEYKLPKDSTERHNRMMLDYFKGDYSRIGDNMPFLEKMFENLIKKPFNYQVAGEVAGLVLEFLDKNPSQIKPNKSIVEKIVFESLESPILSIKLDEVFESFFAKHGSKCGFTG